MPERGRSPPQEVEVSPKALPLLRISKGGLHFPSFSVIDGVKKITDQVLSHGVNSTLKGLMVHSS
jgi:hypothetical protein